MSSLQTVKASQHPDYTTYTLIGLILPIVGVILGVALLVKDKEEDKKLGEHLIAFSILFMILWGCAYYVFTGIL